MKMSNKAVTNVEVKVDFDSLMRRQDELEQELSRLKELYTDMKEKNTITVTRIHDRIDKLEKELVDLRETLNELKASISLIQTGVTTVQKHVSDINAKQDVAIVAQDKFINQLWKAFFSLLGVITLIGSALVAFIK